MNFIDFYISHTPLITSSTNFESMNEQEIYDFAIGICKSGICAKREKEVDYQIPVENFVNAVNDCSLLSEYEKENAIHQFLYYAKRSQGLVLSTLHYSELKRIEKIDDLENAIATSELEIKAYKKNLKKLNEELKKMKGEDK